MPDSWEPVPTTEDRARRARRESSRGTAHGRSASAVPVPYIDRSQRPESSANPVIVQDDEPDLAGLEAGQLWFDQDEPVPT